MTFTVKLQGICSSGNHIDLLVTTDSISRRIVLTKADFGLEPEDYETALVTLLRSFIKESGLTNWAQIKTAIESKVFTL